MLLKIFIAMWVICFVVILISVYSIGKEAMQNGYKFSKTKISIKTFIALIEVIIITAIPLLNIAFTLYFTSWATSGINTTHSLYRISWDNLLKEAEYEENV